MAAENTANLEKQVWVEDKVFGFLKVSLPPPETDEGQPKPGEAVRPADKGLAEGEGLLFKSETSVGRVKTVDKAASTITAEFADGSIGEGLPLKQETVLTCKLTVHGKHKLAEKSVYLELNDPCHSVLDKVKEALQGEDFAFVQLFTSDKLLLFEHIPKKKDEPKFEVIEEPKEEEPKAEEVPKPEEEVKEEAQPTENQPAPTDEQPTEEPVSNTTPEQPLPEVAVEAVPVEEKIEEKTEEPQPVEEVKPETTPVEEEKIEEQPPKEEEKPKSTFTLAAPSRESDELVVLDRYKKVGEYRPELWSALEVYMEYQEGYRFAQTFDHVLTTEDTPRTNYSTLLSLTTPVILRGLGVIGPAPSVVGTPILDCTLIVANLSSGQRSHARVKKEGASDKCHFYFLEPPLACAALDQVEVSVDCHDSVARRGRFLKVVKEDNVFFGLEGTKFSIDYQKNSMIAGICYSLLTELH